MAADKQPIIIKKKKGGGHAGHHGGAWKVAYADFVTAMMCFFLVMWLMGADEETKAAIEQYFKNPNVPWKSSTTENPDALPVGDRNGNGDDVLKGMDGAYPEDLISRPVRPVNQLIENQSLAELIQDTLDGEAFGIEANPDFVKFSLPEKLVFDAGTKDLNMDARKALDKLAPVFRDFKGYITVAGHTDDKPRPVGFRAPAGTFTDNWELSLGRAVEVMRYLVEAHRLDEQKLMPVGQGSRKPFAANDTPDGREKNRRVEFVMSLKRNMD